MFPLRVGSRLLPGRREEDVGELLADDDELWEVMGGARTAVG